MRSAFWLVCFVVLPGVAGAQYISNYVPPADPYYRGPYVAQRYYGYGGDMVQFVPRGATGGYYSTPRNYDWRSAAPSQRAARYFYYPNYPGMNYSPPPARRADMYSQPPLTRTPYHDPYFEEHYWEALREGRDVSEYWGW